MRPFLRWQIAQNHINDAKTVNHESLYSYHHLRDLSILLEKKVSHITNNFCLE
jgi:hypothetical protein